MRLEDSIPLETLKAMDDKDALLGHLSPLQSVLDNVPKLAISSQDAQTIRHGQAIVLLPHIVEKFREESSDSRLAIAVDQNSAVALGEVRAGRFQPNKVFQL